MKVFLDANVFVAAAGSLKGGSAFILQLSKNSEFEIVTVAQALIEAERNVAAKLGVNALGQHHKNLLEIPLQLQPISDISLEEIAMLEKLVPMKDVPILLGALQSKAHFLITLDRRDFVDNPKLSAHEMPFQIVTPGAFLASFLQET
ncbi:MAG: hypothetical protein A3H64_03695 [Candidatus Ryanbacteria bacterium RIFCSPLOWO2_02_FULL_45_11c]|uniref:PIN domain-containing protein n=1 Tax=Candidatus Ryanbacteria bacterium RIFCSPLOWO2_02_FULL_45_11c TaxID=1802128 RepID=A0A1G2GY48_9BACT|nr:MAG: hypothetical protein A3H64_03695 [Candidatus Ryanbacteria bacterium RIFCSPLOWO2_02_FULL_45_11c]